MNAEKFSRFRFSYHIQEEYDSQIMKQNVSLRALPQTDARQRICALSMQCPDFDCWTNSDGFGNRHWSLCCSDPHRTFDFTVEGTVLLSAAARFAGKDHPIYHMQTALTRPSGEMEGFSNEIKRPEDRSDSDCLAFAEAMSEKLYSDMSYQPGITGTGTTAAQAFELRGGVCQDYAHILLGLLRYHGISCRYAAGLAFESGKTHAWIEVYDRGSWYGIDPTNQCAAGTGYLKFSHGPDAFAASVSRGVYCGSAAYRTDIRSELKRV